MEHKLILGGAQYLPFARNRISAMRATGLKYGSQKFVFQDGEVEVRLVGDESYIRLNGGDYAVLSGVVRDGDLIDLPIPAGSAAGTEPVKTLRDYKPTQEAWKFVLKSDLAKSPEAFNDEKKLAVKAHVDTGLDTAKSQYKTLSASMYSGLMSKAVQVIMGYGTKTGTKVKYDHRWERCHGIAIAQDGAKWLVEISLVNGVIAMPLPLFAGTAKYGTSKQAVLSETVKLFGGLPSGGSFPLPDKLEAAITAGTVLRLKSVADMDLVFLKSTFSPLLGWSFSPLGAEAQNTCYRTTGDDVFGCRYKLALSIGPKILDRPVNTPLARASAVLTLEEEGPLTRRDGSPARLIPFAFAWDRDGLLKEVPAKFVTSDPVATAAPLLATFDNDGVLDVVRVEVVVAQPLSDVRTGTYDACQGQGYTRPGGWSNRALSTIAGGRTITSTKYPLVPGTTGTVSTEYATQVFVGTKVWYAPVIAIEYMLQASIFDLVKFHRLYYMNDTVYDQSTKPAIAGVWPLGARDCYALSDPGGNRTSYHSRARITAGGTEDDNPADEGNSYVTYRNATFYQYPAVNPDSFPTVTVTKGVRTDGSPCLWNYIGSSDFASEGLMATTAWYAEINALPTLASLPAVAWLSTLPATVVSVQDARTVRIVTPFGTITEPMGEDEAGVWKYPAPIFNSATSYAVRFSAFGPNRQTMFSYSIQGYAYPGVERVGTMLSSEFDPAPHTYSFIGYI